MKVKFVPICQWACEACRKKLITGDVPFLGEHFNIVVCHDCLNLDPLRVAKMLRQTFSDQWVRDGRPDVEEYRAAFNWNAIDNLASKLDAIDLAEWKEMQETLPF